jgi:uncharacterized protein YecE (DUF72 family)
MALLKDAGKLGMIALQFPPYFIAKGPNFDYLADLPERSPGGIYLPAREPHTRRSLSKLESEAPDAVASTEHRPDDDKTGANLGRLGHQREQVDRVNSKGRADIRNLQ